MTHHLRSLEFISATLQGSWVASGKQKFTPNYSMFNFQVTWVALLRHKPCSPGSFLGSLFLQRLKIHSKAPAPNQHPGVAGTSPVAQTPFENRRKAVLEQGLQRCSVDRAISNGLKGKCIISLCTWILAIHIDISPKYGAFQQEVHLRFSWEIWKKIPKLRLSPGKLNQNCWVDPGTRIFLSSPGDSSG